MIDLNKKKVRIMETEGERGEYKYGCGYLECIATDCKGCFTQKVNEPSWMDTVYLWGLLLVQKIDGLGIISIIGFMTVVFFLAGLYVGLHLLG